MFLLDTNVISELRKHSTGRANPNVVAWVSRQDAASFYMSAITLMELELGVLLMERRDAKQGSLLRRWLDDQVRATFSDRTIPVDTAVALRCAALHVPDPRPNRDAYIAATALVHGMTLITRNTADFEPTGVALVNPWTA